MEFFDSNCLKDVLFDDAIKQDYELSEGTKKKIILQICRGVIYLHHKGVIHRDLKPANILISKTFDYTKGYEVKICDFGLSRINDMASEMLTTAGKNIARGTIIYMAPEVLLEYGSGSIFSDRWSLGCVVNEIFTGNITWYHELEVENMREILGKQKMPNLKNVPLYLIDILSKFFDYDPNKRPTPEMLYDSVV